MKIKERLRLIPMLVDAYREARLQFETVKTENYHSTHPTLNFQRHNLAKIDAVKKAPTMTKGRRRTKQIVPIRISSGTIKPMQKSKRLSPSFSYDQRLIREFRAANSKSWNRLKSIQKKLRDVEKKVEGLKGELQRAEKSTDGDQ